MTNQIFYDVSRFGEEEIYYFKEGTLYRAYKYLGAHPMERQGVKGVYFAVWAPNAGSVSVIGDFNEWNNQSHPLSSRWDSSGIWEGFIPGINAGALYKFHIKSRFDGYQADKKDPFAFGSENPPSTASIVVDLSYEWQDGDWMAVRKKHNSSQSPISIYELHLGSWMRNVEENRWLNYREVAEKLTAYVTEMGYTHVEFMPVMDHPFYGSWGYQVLGYFAATSRYGSPEDLMFLIDTLHQNGIGVILDWVPSHFPGDEVGLVYFDGTHLYEHQDPRKGFHPDWKSYIFNYGRNEIREFLISSAMFWLDKYHVDGLRVDGVASMLYLDYSRQNGEWIPNENGGRDNLDAIYFIRQLNESVYRDFPDVQMYAEESTDWPNVSRPTYLGGLGFGMKWNMGWMHDTLKYFSRDMIYRKYHHNELTFSMLYAYTENFVLSLSHDEVVHGKGSLLNKMPGDDWQKFANLRLLLGYMYAHPGKKLFFMGGDIGQWAEWNHERSIDWHILNYDVHKGIQNLVRDLNHFYRATPSFFELDFDPEGFEWIQCDDWQQSVLCFIRKSKDPKDTTIVACNFTPVPRDNYKVGVPFDGYWKEVINSDAAIYGGAGIGNMGGKNAERKGFHYRPYSLSITVPPLAVVYFKWQGPAIPMQGLIQ
ncbi:MAG: 1,4-alpha-glucan branching protein GlgB [Candidatus Omnitrophota bacterium]